jgi:hypothetical protein
MQLFETTGDFQAFERVLEETRDETPMRICDSCPNRRSVGDSGA